MNDDLRELENNCHRALNCLYLEAPELVVRDVKAAVLAYVDALKADSDALAEGRRLLDDVALADRLVATTRSLDNLQRLREAQRQLADWQRRTLAAPAQAEEE